MTLSHAVNGFFLYAYNNLSVNFCFIYLIIPCGCKGSHQQKDLNNARVLVKGKDISSKTEPLHKARFF